MAQEHLKKCLNYNKVRNLSLRNNPHFKKYDETLVFMNKSRIVIGCYFKVKSNRLFLELRKSMGVHGFHHGERTSIQRCCHQLRERVEFHE